MGDEFRASPEIRPQGASRRHILRVLAFAPAVAAGVIVTRGVASNQQEDEAGTPEASPVGSPAASPAAIIEVQMTDGLRFDPESATIRAGETIRWVNASAMPHTATGDPEQNPVDATNPEYVVLPDGAEPWGSDMLQPGDTFEHTFTVPGRYEYLCIPHVLSGMRGSIEVM
jgi:plastocyanin